MHAVDLSLLAAYVGWSLWSGLSNRARAGRDLEEYFLAGRSLSGWQAGMSMAATQFAADTPLVVTGLVATAGLFSLWRLWVYAIAFLLMAVVLGASWRRAGVVTDAQLTEVRYGGRPAAALRAIKAVYFGLVFNCTVLAMVLLAATRITEPFLRWDQWLPAAVFEPVRAVVAAVGVPITAGIVADPSVATANNLLSIGIIVAVTTTYSTTGGLRAVVRTDVAQLVIALLATAGYAAVVLSEVGGRAGLVAALRAELPGPVWSADSLLALTPDLAPAATLPFLGVLAIQWLCQINADGSGYLAQRIMACKSDADARTAGVVFVVLQVLVRSLLWLPIALGLLVLFPEAGAAGAVDSAAAREATFVRGVAELLPPGLLGLALTGMLAALASTLDTHLNWGSSYLTNDLGRRFVAPALGWRLPESAWVSLARVGNLLILAVALAALPFLGSIQQAWQASLLLGAGVGVLLVLRWLWWRINAAGELAALGASALAAPVLLAVVGDDAVRLLLAAGLATTVGVGVSLATPPEHPDLLAAFHARAHPPGFWGPHAPDPAGGRRRLGAGAAATLGGAGSVFALLVGLGTLLVGAPAPLGLPVGPWVGGLLVVGLGTVPLWVRLARHAGPSSSRPLAAEGPADPGP